MLLFTAMSVSGQEPLVIVLQAGNTAPYVLGPHDKPTGGIVVETALRVGKDLGMPVVFTEMSRKRMVDELLADPRHEVCPILNPAWTEEPEVLAFSGPLFVERNRLVVRSDKSLLYDHLIDLEGKTIGGLLGYIYPPAFQDLVDHGKVFRSDVTSPTQNYQKLLAGRIDGFIHADLLALYDLKTNPAYKGLSMAAYVLSTQNIQWALNTKGPVFNAKLFAKLDALKDEGFFDTLLRKYR